MIRSILFAVSFGFFVALSAAPAVSASLDEIRETLEKQFGVDVLRMQETESGGRAVVIATVMSRVANSNAALQVNRLVVDRKTGLLVSQFRHLASGYAIGGGGPNDPLDDTGLRGRRLLSQTR